MSELLPLQERMRWVEEMHRKGPLDAVARRVALGIWRDILSELPTIRRRLAAFRTQRNMIAQQNGWKETSIYAKKAMDEKFGDGSTDAYDEEFVREKEYVDYTYFLRRLLEEEEPVPPSPASA